MAAGALTNAWNPVGWILGIGAGLVALGGIVTTAINNDVQEIEESALNEIAAERQKLGRDLTDTEVKNIADKYDPTGDLAKSLAGTVEALNNTNDMAEAINENTAALRANSELILS
jgi:hypothetical protein